MSKPPKHRVVPGHSYKVSFGVNQTEEINKAANIKNQTPVDFIKSAVFDSVDLLNDGISVVNNKQSPK
ncbi:hypothetical protein ACK3YG_06365 [Aeromonas caviae]|uniref:hypothetical protein n=1 Tax=Aeromonas caviae TaxID=648 RepID=UPI002B46E9E1|nr:hypothetical protein [Aeromonas caviae]